MQHADIPPPQSATIARNLLLISYPDGGRGLSWSEHMVSQQLAQGCLQMTRSEIRT